MGHIDVSDVTFTLNFDRFLVFGGDGAVYEADAPVGDEGRVVRPHGRDR
ncbi:hypothetical protein [Cryobacterium tagatosivorans]|nr:hypothetical protein [Cryobacterium tagatosivorans]